MSKLSDAFTAEAMKVVRDQNGVSLLRATAEWLENCADPDLRATESTVAYLRAWADALEGGAQFVQEGHAVVDGKVRRLGDTTQALERPTTPAEIAAGAEVGLTFDDLYRLIPVENSDG